MSTTSEMEWDFNIRMNFSTAIVEWPEAHIMGRFSVDYHLFVCVLHLFQHL